MMKLIKLPSVILSEAVRRSRRISLLFVIVLSACTDYVSQIEDERDEWRSAREQSALLSSGEVEETSGSSSSAILSGDSHKESSSSSVKSNGSSSSVFLSGDSREESSSTVKSCSSEKTASSSSSSAKSNVSSSSSGSLSSIDVNHAPFIRDTAFTIDENLANGSFVGRIIAFDPDTILAYCALTYAILTSDVPFILDSNIIKVENSNRLDYEVNPAFTFLVRVSDGMFCDTALVVVNLKDVNEMQSSSSSGKASWAYLNPAISYGEMTDDRDGQVYKTVEIGEQTWMAENLNLEIGASLCYECDVYGRLYTWSLAMDSAGIYSGDGKGCTSSLEKSCTPSYPVRGICPENWHLPDSNELSVLKEATSQGDLKSKSGWYVDAKINSNGQDNYGFSGVPVGYWYSPTNTYGHKSNLAAFWSSSENVSVQNRYNAYAMLLAQNNVNSTSIGGSPKTYGYSVRCLKNEIPKSSSSISSSSSSKASWAYLNPSYSYGEMVDNRDGQVYKTVEIGVQTWMAENLNYAYLPLEAGSDSLSFCYDNDPLNCSKYGRLYRWSAAMDSAGMFSTTGKGCGYSVCLPTGNVRGVCPEGWHLPSKNEIFNSDYSNPIYWQDSISSWYMSGLTIPASGYMPNYGVFGFKGEYAGLWTSSEVASDGNAFSLFLRYDDSFTRKDGDNKNNGYSVRCVKD